VGLALIATRTELTLGLQKEEVYLSSHCLAISDIPCLPVSIAAGRVLDEIVDDTTGLLGS
jgi:hypothetical protein